MILLGCPSFSVQYEDDYKATLSKNKAQMDISCLTFLYFGINLSQM